MTQTEQTKMTTLQLAEYWKSRGHKIHPGTIRHWRTVGKGPKYSKLGHNGRVMYDIADVTSFEKETGLESLLAETKKGA